MSAEIATSKTFQYESVEALSARIDEVNRLTSDYPCDNFDQLVAERYRLQAVRGHIQSGYVRLTDLQGQSDETVAQIVRYLGDVYTAESSLEDFERRLGRMPDSQVRDLLRSTALGVLDEARRVVSSNGHRAPTDQPTMGEYI